MANKKYWQSFTELASGDEQQKLSVDEFNEPLTVSHSNGKEIEEGGASRRDFLKYLGFSTAAAALAASCETPVRKVIPFVNKPMDVVPGVADFYATTFVSGGESIPVVAKVRDGRPIKLEGNSFSTFTKGGTTARVQASVLELYDTSRLRYPTANGTAVTIENADSQIIAALNGLGGAPIVLLTPTVTSPTTLQVIQQFTARFAGTRHVQYDSIPYSGILLANEASYGRRAIPSYRFENAKVIVSLGADFLGTWLNPVEYQNGYGVRRRVSPSNLEMSKHYHFESMMSMTGANADERFTHRPSETLAVAQALLAAVSGQPVTGLNEKLTKGIQKVVRDLTANRGASLVVSGSNNPAVQTVVNAINEAVGSNGTTIDWSAPLLTKQGLERDFVTLITDMEAGRVGGIIIHDVNPVYDFFDGAGFANALKRVKVTISTNQKKDETAELCKFIVPSHHFLESWGDAEAKTGYFSMMQPTINPLFKTRQFQDSLLKWSGATTNYETFFRTFWTGRLGDMNAFNKALQDGIVEPATATPATAPFNGAAVASLPTNLAGQRRTGGKELVLYQNVAMGDGRQANNPWLLELPDPITRATWDNYAMVSTKLGKELFDIDISKQRDADEYEVNTRKPLVRIKAGNKEIVLPALIIPGMHEDTIAIAVGYGRKSASGKEEDTAKNIGRAVVGAGQNVFPFATFNGTTIDYNIGEVTIASTGDTYVVAQTQTHNSYEGRHEVVKEVTLNELREHPNVVLDERKKELAPWGGLERFEDKGTLYPVYDRPGVHWGMSIDLNSCYGCGACVVACHVENNVPVVGKKEVARFHDMHWLRIDRYFSGDPNDPESIQTIFQPMLCQHCDNAPCENVCPVAATPHSNEGINQMVYNRCIGTRYCANNCPYKVRRFNWADYTRADSFDDNQLKEGVGSLDEAVFMMNDDLTRMVLNPDVTVRSRGVMEKCSFCVQRLQAGKLQAKKENRVLTDQDAQTACAQACPANAIVFGNANNSQSAVSKTRTENNNRVYHVLEQLHTLPNVSYLAKVRNTEVLTAHHPNEDENVEQGKKVETHFSK
jgi:MoCo/4Fe-4S cofactor protein with predicted Tat translocation signal